LVANKAKTETPHRAANLRKELIERERILSSRFMFDDIELLLLTCPNTK
jgi:hypothetical protein